MSRSTASSVGMRGEEVDDRLGELPGELHLPNGLGGLRPSPTTALLAAWRARLLPWWPAAAILVAEVCARAVPGGFGLLIWSAALCALSYVLYRAVPRIETDADA
jgi:hypothetical protein